MSFIQRYPFIVIAGVGVTLGAAFAGLVYTAFSSLEDKNSIIEKIKNFKENLSLNSLKSNSPSPK